MKKYLTLIGFVCSSLLFGQNRYTKLLQKRENYAASDSNPKTIFYIGLRKFKIILGLLLCLSFTNLFSQTISKYSKTVCCDFTVDILNIHLEKVNIQEFY